jgi:hypothetical protein
MPRTPNRVNFATPIAHREDQNYAAFAGALTIGRPFRQPLETAPDPALHAPGLEIFLSSAGDVSRIFAWLDGTLTWVAATVADPGHRLVLETDPLNHKAPGAALSFASLKTVEAKPGRAVYENVDQDAVRDALVQLLTTVHAAAGQTGNQANWHPSMRMQVLQGNQRLKVWLDQQAQQQNLAAGILQVVNGFLGLTPTAVVRQMRVQAADPLGRAAPYLATDPLPPTPAFPLGAPGDANRARRLTFRVSDTLDQVIDPRYYLHLFIHQSRVPTTGTPRRIVYSMTTLLDAAGTAVAHPLADLYPVELGTAAAIPLPRARVNNVIRWPIGPLANFHRAPPANPLSQLRWRYRDAGGTATGVLFEAQVHAPPATLPNLNATGPATTKMRLLWNGRAAPTPPATAPPARDPHGAVIATLCETFQVPAELVAGLVGSESLPDLNERVIRMEPIKFEDRGPVTPANLLAYDETIGTTATVTAATLLPNGRAELQIQLAAAKRWETNVLSRRGQRIMVGPAGQRERLRIVANSGSATAVTNYTLTVSDGVRGFASGPQSAGQTRFYAPTRRAGGHAGQAAAQEALPRAGEVGRLEVRVDRKSLNGPLQVRVVRNGAATGLTVTLPPNVNAAQAAAGAFQAAAGDTLSVEVVAGGTSGEVRGLQWEIGHRPAGGAQWQHPAWLLEGFGPPDGVPDPWNPAALVRAGRPMTWGQLEQIVGDVEGSRMSPGLLQTLISTAWSTLPFIQAVAPGIFAALGTTRPATHVDMFHWLLEGANSLLCGVAYMRMQYLENGTRWDLPMVGGAYNAGSPTPAANTLWGLTFYGKYVEHAAPHLNAASTLFDTAGALTTGPSVRLMR